MKRLRSSDDLDSYGKDPNPNPNPTRSSLSSHRSFYYKSETARKGLLSSSTSSPSAARYDRERLVDDEREGTRIVRKRADHEFDGFDRRKGFDRYRDGGGGGESRGYDRNLMHRSESFCVSRKEFPKGFRSERDRSRREGSVSSWRRFGSSNKEFEEGGGSRSRLEERGKGLRDVRSPTWSNSKDSGSEQSKVRSPPRGLRDGKSMSKSKSPTWSKDSVGSEQSKSVEVKKRENQVQVESSSSSEMEEGELEPEPEPEPERGQEAEPEPEPETETIPEGAAEMAEEARVEVDSDRAAHREIESECPVEDNIKTAMVDKDEVLSKEEVDRDKSLSKEEVDETNRESFCEEQDVENQVDGMKNCENNLIDESHASKSRIVTEANNEDGKREEEGSEHEDECHEAGKDRVEEKSVQLEGECKQDNGIDLEVKAEDVEVGDLDVEVMEENGAPKEEELTKETDNLAQSFKDKGKSLAVTPTIHVADSTEDGVCVEREPRDLLTSRDSDMEGPSTRGFDLFSSSPVRRQEKAERSGVNMQKDEQLTLVPLDLSLSLPNVLLPVGAAPGSPGQARSVQSLSNTFRTNSDGFTASVSFSGSQSFYHNPSCSLTQNSMDNFEQSVKSRPIFQGIDWQALSQSESKQKEVPLYQRILMNGNGNNQQSQGVSNGQSPQGHPKIPEGSSKMSSGLERQLSLHQQLSGGQSKHHDDVRSPSHSVGSHEMGSNYSIDRKRVMREKSSGSLYRSSSMKEHEQFLIGGADFVETVIARIVSEPIHAMARKFHEMTGQSIACLKESIREILLNVDKRGQIFAVQKALQDRSDITLEMLLKSHRAQLEILVALKTALPDFIQQANSVSSTDLAEIFLNLRCRNIACRSFVPVDECDCKVCVQKNGFCSSCMCLLCAKFDMASNTCSWVGCDVCLHWCHTDCGLRESYIRNGRSATGAQGTSEMQFHCVACDHPSEMFGFVKEVFQNFAKEWTAETFSKELEYVKRIFVASKDLRGKRLHEIAGQMLARLANKSELSEVYGHIMAFLTGNISIFSNKSVPLIICMYFYLHNGYGNHNMYILACFYAI